MYNFHDGDNIVLLFIATEREKHVLIEDALKIEVNINITHQVTIIHLCNSIWINIYIICVQRNVIY